LRRVPALAQDRLKTMPGYEQYARMAPLIRSALGAPQGFGGRGGGGGITWATDGKSFEFDSAGKRLRFDIGTKKVTNAPPTTDNRLVDAVAARRRSGARTPIRVRGGAGRQPSRDLQGPQHLGRRFHGAGAVQITTEAASRRIKYGTASWVYARSRSDDRDVVVARRKKLAYYRFDESKVPTFTSRRLTQIHDSLDIEAYPKPGDANPVVDLFRVRRGQPEEHAVDVRDGLPFQK